MERLGNRKRLLKRWQFENGAYAPRCCSCPDFLHSIAIDDIMTLLSKHKMNELRALMCIRCGVDNSAGESWGIAAVRSVILLSNVIIVRDVRCPVFFQIWVATSLQVVT